MNEDSIIKAAYDGMADAGSYDWFCRQVKNQLDESSDPDPVAVTISHAIRDNIDLEGVASTLSYYASELQRASHAITELHRKSEKENG